MRAWRWTKRALLLLAAAWLLLVLFAHRWFAVDRPSGARDLVVEGWLYAGGCDTVAEWFRRGSYDRFHTTGTIRPFTYQLHCQDTLEVLFDPPISGDARLRIDGLPHGLARIIAGERDTIDAVPSAGSVSFSLSACSVLRIAAGSSNPPPDGQPVIFAGHLSINGANAHGLASSLRIRRANGALDEGWPSFAHEARDCLMQAGIPPDRIHPVPTATLPGGRTWSNAQAFAAFAASKGIERFDVATMGVHARRTWRTYRKAAGHDAGIGIRSIHDPWCARGRWWLNPFGWILVLKEVAAIPAPAIIGDAEREARR